MNIGDAAKRTGLTAKMIRHYESLGLLCAQRGDNGYRTYGDADVLRLQFIRHSRDAGFTMAQIKTLLALRDDPRRSSADVKQLTASHIATLKLRKAEIESMIATLEALTAACHGDANPACPIIDSLAADDERTAIRLGHAQQHPLKRIGA